MIDPLSFANVSGPTYKGTLGTLRHILREEGLTALWKGNIPAEVLYVAYGGIQFSTYRTSSRLISSLPQPYIPPDAAVSFVSGALAGTVATAATYPLDLLRTRFAAQGTERVYAGLLSSIREIRRHEGNAGFYRGLGAAVGQIVPYMGLFFTSYEALKLPLATLSLPFGSGDAIAGTVASIFSKTAVFPLDTVRKRLQVQGPSRARFVHRNIPVYAGVLATFKAILRKEGIRGLYRGLPVGLFKAAPASAVTLWTYERAMHVLQAMDRNIERL